MGVRHSRHQWHEQILPHLVLALIALVHSINQSEYEDAGNNVFSVLHRSTVAIAKARLLFELGYEMSVLGSSDCKPLGNSVAPDLVVVVAGNVEEGCLLGESEAIFLGAIGPFLAVPEDFVLGVQSQDITLLDLGKLLVVLVVESVLHSPGKVGALDAVEIVALEVLDPVVGLDRVPTLFDVK